MDKTETLHKEVDLIQNIISRMANNSFLLKGWVITIIVAVLALTKETLVTNDVTYLSMILLFPLIIFWYLDAYFLHKERCYRKLYTWVIQNRETSDDCAYNLDYTRFKNEVDGILKTMFSPTLRVFYGMTTIILVGVFIYNLIQ